MAEESDLERTEPASPRRREQAREDGQIARSRELSTFALLLTAGGVLTYMGGAFTNQLAAMMQHGLQIDRAQVFNPGLMLLRLQGFSQDMLVAFAPLFILLLIVGVASTMMLNGWMFSPKPLMPQWSRLDPLQGMKRILSWTGVIEMIKASAKTILIGGVAVWVIWKNGGAILSLSQEPLRAGLAHAAEITGHCFLVISGSIALVVLIDVPFQLWEHERKMRMTREEVRQENKESEGDPHVKAHIRSQQREIARRRMMSEIPKADVVVTNPTHFAVALRYQGGKMQAPQVVAKGAHLLAARIRALAEEHKVPVLEAPPLARALYRHAELGDEIPAPLYNAVAEVLAYVYQLRRHAEFGGVVPELPTLASFPHELDPGEATA